MSASDVSVDVDMMAELPAASMLAFIARKQKTDQFFRETAVMLRDAAPFFRFLEQKGIEIRFDPDYCYVAFNFTGTGGAFAEMWAELRRNGFTPTRRPEKGDVEFSAYWDHPGYARIFMSFASTVCKRVQVGTKMVEQAIYETQCGDPLPEISEETPAPALPPPSEPVDSDIAF
jgi:hypothetical protein